MLRREEKRWRVVCASVSDVKYVNVNVLWSAEMSTQAYYKERLGFDPADTVAEHQREQRSQYGYEECLSKFKGQNHESVFQNGCEEDRQGTTAHWGCWAMFIEAHGRWRRTLTQLKNECSRFEVFCWTPVLVFVPWLSKGLVFFVFSAGFVSQDQVGLDL